MNSAGFRRIYTLAHSHDYSQVLNYGKQPKDSFMSSLLSSKSCEVGIEYLLGPFEVGCGFLANETINLIHYSLTRCETPGRRCNQYQ